MTAFQLQSCIIFRWGQTSQNEYINFFFFLQTTRKPNVTLEGQHPHVHPRQLAVGHLQLLQRVGEAGGERVILLGDDGKLLLWLLYVFGTHGSEGGEGKAARVAPSVRQAGGRQEVLQAAGISLRKTRFNSRQHSGQVQLRDVRHIPWNNC